MQTRQSRYPLAPDAPRGRRPARHFSRGPLVASLTALWLLAGAPGCADDDTADPSTDAGPTAGGDAGLPDSGTVDPGLCVRCSMVLGFLTGGVPPGGGGPGGDPCEPGNGGGPGQMPAFCDAAGEQALQGLFTCLQAHCADACPFGAGPGGGPPQCQDGGTSAPDAGATSCDACLQARCVTEAQQCAADE